MREPLHWDGRRVDRILGLLIGCMGLSVLAAYASSSRVGRAKALGGRLPAFEAPASISFSNRVLAFNVS